jgi:hypothetical protein
MNLVFKHWRPLFDGDACRDGRQDNLSLRLVQARSQIIFSGVDRTTRGARLIFRDLAMVFDQAPIVLTAAECAAHWHLVSSEHEEIARLSAEQGFQVAARSRARKLYAGFYAHRDTPPANHSAL